MKTALLISTYNWASALQLVLKSIEQQSVVPDEILIADDGSTIETKQLVEEFKAKNNWNIKHIWHEDKGFRKSMILNKAVAQSTSDYIIQIDGDCIMHPKFVEDHKKNALPNTYLYGTRATITKEALPEVYKNQNIYFHFFSKNIKKRSRTIYSPFLSKFYQVHQGVSSNFRGCNVSYWKRDFLEVNGYNELFEGWGREDSDLVIRMANKGVMAKRLRYIGIVYHIYHPENSRALLEKNNAIQQQSIEQSTIRIEKGVSQYL